MKSVKVCPKCGHSQRLFEPTIRKLRSYGHRIIRCSRCGARIRLKWRNGNVTQDNKT